MDRHERNAIQGMPSTIGLADRACPDPHSISGSENSCNAIDLDLFYNGATSARPDRVFRHWRIGACPKNIGSPVSCIQLTAHLSPAENDTDRIEDAGFIEFQRIAAVALI